MPEFEGWLDVVEFAVFLAGWSVLLLRAAAVYRRRVRGQRAHRVVVHHVTDPEAVARDVVRYIERDRRRSGLSLVMGVPR